MLVSRLGSRHTSLNALSGIGGVRTSAWGYRSARAPWSVLMPCRALEAFGPFPQVPVMYESFCLNALSGIGGVRTQGAGPLREGAEGPGS